MFIMSGDQDEFERVLVRASRLVQSQFLEVPGLRLTGPQTAILCSLDSDVCSIVLDRLIAARFLVRTRHATFARAAEIDSGA
jgi:hypothetical protein